MREKNCIYRRSQYGEMKKMKEEYEIIPLPREEWKGTPILMVVESEEYYDVHVAKQADGYLMSLKKKKALPTIRHTPEEYDFPDSLYQDHWEKAQAWGIVEETDGKKNLMACIETCPEEWSNRLMVTELWVHENLRHQGIGHRLMDIAKRQAKEEKRRALILETQSYNVNAIGFYMHEGFELIGFDSCCYTNYDIKRREVRLDLGIIFDGFPDGKRFL